MEQNNQRENQGSAFQNTRRILFTAKNTAQNIAKTVGFFANPSALPIIVVSLVLAFTFIIVLTSTVSGMPQPGTSGAVSPAPSGVAPSISYPPPNTLISAIKTRFGIEFDTSFREENLTWTFEVLQKAEQRAPKFFNLLHHNYSNIVLRTGPVITNTSGNIITFKNFSNGPLYRQDYFKQVLIHELGHVIYGPTYGPNADLENKINEAIAKDGQTITAYPENSTSDPNKICGIPDQKTKNSEDFADLVSYYINNDLNELDYGCGTKNNQGQNPLDTGKYPNHRLFIRSLLGG